MSFQVYRTALKPFTFIGHNIYPSNQNKKGWKILKSLLRGTKRTLEGFSGGKKSSTEKTSYVGVHYWGWNSSFSGGFSADQIFELFQSCSGGRLCHCRCIGELRFDRWVYQIFYIVKSCGIPFVGSFLFSESNKKRSPKFGVFYWGFFAAFTCN